MNLLYVVTGILIALVIGICAFVPYVIKMRKEITRLRKERHYMENRLNDFKGGTEYILEQILSGIYAKTGLTNQVYKSYEVSSTGIKVRSKRSKNSKSSIRIPAKLYISIEDKEISLDEISEAASSSRMLKLYQKYGLI